MFLADKHQRPAAWTVLAALILATALSVRLPAQQSPPPVPAAEPSPIALPIAEDRGAAALEQSLKRLQTTASLMMIVAHPDDEDGTLLTTLSRSLGVRCTLLTLTRGEGGQNAISADSDGALGLIRTNELLKADEFYGAKQLWGTEVDFGFSKTQEEAFARWGHDRVLYDAVLAVRRERPQIIVSTFVGGVTDGHGHHQVSGEIAQEVFKAAADPTVFPDQLKPVSDGGHGLTVWQPLAVYSMVPFARIEGGKMFDYATGKWAPAKFKNYVTGEWSQDAPSTDATIQVGTRDPILGRSYVQIARKGWGMQKSQYGGANPTLSGPAATNYHLWAAVPSAAAPPGAGATGNDLFHNSKAAIDTTLNGLPNLVKGAAPNWLAASLHSIDNNIQNAEAERKNLSSVDFAHKLARIYRHTLDLKAEIASSNLDPQSKASLLFELDAKITEFQSVLQNLLGLDLVAFTTKSESVQNGGSRGSTPDETPRSVTPGEQFRVRVHAAQSTSESRLNKIWLESSSGDPWKYDQITAAFDPAAPIADPIFHVQAAANADPTQPYFARPNIEQPFYDLTHPEFRLRSFAPWPLAAWAEFIFDGLPIRIGQVVQTMQRVPGQGGIYEPLVVTPAIGVRLDPEARILPLDGSALPVRVTVHAQSAAEGTVDLHLPAGWTSDPAEAHFQLESAGDTEPLLFSVSTDGTETGAYNINAVVHAILSDRTAPLTYTSGWQSIGYPGLRPYNLFKSAQLQTRKIDVKLAPGLSVAYVMGTGDLVPEAIEALGATPHLLTDAELTTADLSAWNVIVIGIRAYSTRPELSAAQLRLNEFVRRGGTLIVQYQSAGFPAPFPLSMGRTSERVVDEQAPVKLLQPANPLLTSPNAITPADFDGWVEERGHSFLDTWDPAYTALTETADPGQDPQRGGLLIAHPGKGTYIYVAFALHRQLPELVPGAYRLLANILSAGRGIAGNQ
jgi:LmbE family N-acetylglucosaminyl deacetylase